jgi:hypothetical protein
VRKELGKLPSALQGKTYGLLQWHPNLTGFTSCMGYIKNPWFPFLCHIDIGLSFNVCVEGSQQWYGVDRTQIPTLKKVLLLAFCIA